MKKRWKKYGLVLAVAYLVFVGLMFLIFQRDIGDFGKTVDWMIFFSSMPLSLIFVVLLISFELSRVMGLTFLIVIGTIQYASIGALIGVIVDKIKAKKTIN